MPLESFNPEEIKTELKPIELALEQGAAFIDKLEAHDLFYEDMFIDQSLELTKIWDFPGVDAKYMHSNFNLVLNNYEDI